MRTQEGDKTVELFLSDEGDEVVIEVADQGCGVPEALREKIFEQGVSTRTDEPGEHGIGLYLIASYVGRCGGVITLEDNDPCGTLFSLFLPKVKKNDDRTINPIDR
ncbi:sensor kinase [Salmonella enterica subsp. diarizonae]|uniref:histidine kinase n=1 Tax=Salmonella diarizonae TaxID=59204 RepID=A0A379U2D9_SALDZ|nr:sensor kinase [Salmonella enterica subsp. diarizonae]